MGKHHCPAHLPCDFECRALLQSQDKGSLFTLAQGCSLQGPLSNTAEGPLVPPGTCCLPPLKGQAMVSRELLPGITVRTVIGMSQGLWGHLGTAEWFFWSQPG